MKTALSHAQSRLAETEKDDDAVSAPEGSRGPAGGAGAGGMPDLSALAGLMGGMGGGGGAGGGMPDLASMMRNPALMDM
jgi:small glutamine-rich tetratricopeptide repeat-containing protein alpha